MSNYPDLKNDVELFKIKTKDDQLKELQYKTEKHDLENILKSLKSDNVYYKKKYNSLNKKEDITYYNRNPSRYFIRCWYFFNGFD